MKPTLGNSSPWCHSPRNIPALGLVSEVVIGDDGIWRGPLGRPYQQVRYFQLKHFVCWKSDSVADAPRLHVLVKLRLCKGGVCSKQEPHLHIQVTLDNRLNELLPPVGDMDVAWSENRSFTVTELVETEQGMIAYALEMAVVGCSLLLTMHWTLGAIDVQDDTLSGCFGYSTFHPLDIQPF